MPKPIVKVLIVIAIATAVSATISARKYSSSHAQRHTKKVEDRRSRLRKFLGKLAAKRNRQLITNHFISLEPSNNRLRTGQLKDTEDNNRLMKPSKKLNAISMARVKEVKSVYKNLIAQNSSIKTARQSAIGQRKRLSNIRMSSQFSSQSALKQPMFGNKKPLRIASPATISASYKSSHSDQTSDTKNINNFDLTKKHPEINDENSLKPKSEDDYGITVKAPEEASARQADAGESIAQSSDSIEFARSSPNMIYETGDFNNIHISQLLLTLADIELYFTDVFHAMRFQAKDMQSEMENASKFPKTHLDVLMLVLLRDSAKIKGKVSHLQERVESIQVNFHNVLDFFELKNEFEELKVKTGFDHGALEEMENRLLKEVEKTAEYFQQMRFYLHGLEVSHKSLLAFIAKEKSSRRESERSSNLLNSHASLDKDFVAAFEKLRLKLMTNLKHLKDQVFLIKQQKLVFDRVFNESKNGVQISRATNGNWIYPITVVLITISAALLI